MSPPSLAMTCSSAGSAVRSSSPTAALAVGPAITARAPMAASSRSISGHGAGGVHRHGHEAGAEHREVGHDEVPVVGGHDADAVAGLEPQRRQPARADRATWRAQVAVGCGLAAGDHRDRGVGVGVDDRRQVHGGSPAQAAAAPPTAGRPRAQACPGSSRSCRGCPLVLPRALPAGAGSRSWSALAVLAGWAAAGASHAQPVTPRRGRDGRRRSPPIRARRRSSSAASTACGRPRACASSRCSGELTGVARRWTDQMVAQRADQPQPEPRLRR